MVVVEGADAPITCAALAKIKPLLLRYRIGRNAPATVEDVEFDGSEAVGESSDADSLDVAGVVAGSACVVIAAVADAVVNDDG